MPDQNIGVVAFSVGGLYFSLVKRVSIIGIGRVGGAIALALDHAGIVLEKLIFRSGNSLSGISYNFSSKVKFSGWDELESIDSGIVIIAAGDPEIAAIAERVAIFDKLPSVALHLSGSLSSDELIALKAKGVSTGSMHPLVSISDPVLGSQRFRGAYFCVEGESGAVATANELVSSLGGKPFTITTDLKPLYHASAVMASGHLVALLDMATEMLSRCGLDYADAKSVLFPLIESTIENTRKQNPVDALTGTFARSDVAAFERHLAAISASAPESFREVYLNLAQRSIDIMRDGKPDDRSFDRLADAILMAKGNGG